MTQNTMLQRPISPQMQECIEACTFCHDACLDTVAYCIEQGGAYVEASHLKLLLDCAEICQTSANFMLRGSELHSSTCATCADVCRRCAESCARFGDDAQMQLCADACRTCAESCAKMASHRSHAA